VNAGERCHPLSPSVKQKAHALARFPNWTAVNLRFRCLVEAELNHYKGRRSKFRCSEGPKWLFGVLFRVEAAIIIAIHPTTEGRQRAPRYWSIVERKALRGGSGGTAAGALSGEIQDSQREAGAAVIDDFDEGSQETSTTGAVFLR